MSFPFQEDTENRLLLIDGHSIIYRSFYGIRGLLTSDGFPTNAIYGYLQTTLKVLEDWPSSHAAVAFDAGRETVRHEEYQDYKADRPEMPEELVRQLPQIEELTTCLGLRALKEEGYEADDIIATLTKRARAEGLPVLIVTSDKDLMQLVSEEVKIFRSGKKGREDKLFDEEGVEDKLGVRPDQVRDFLALTGDASDNIPGVPQVGEVRAKKLLDEFGCLDRIMENVDRISATRVRENLKEHREDALLSRELVRLRDVEGLDRSLDSLRLGEGDSERLKEMFKRLEFSSFLDDLYDCGPEELDWRVVAEKKGLEDLLARLKEDGEFSLDLETDDLNPIEAKVVGVALSLEEGGGCYLPLDHSEGSTLDKDYALERLKPLLEDPELGKIGQNLKYDSLVLKNEGIDLRGITFDSMIASYLIKPSKRQHNLNELARSYLGRELQKYEELFPEEGKGEEGALFSAGEEGEEDFRSLPLEVAAPYAVEDAEVVWALKGPLEEKLEEKGQLELFRELELPLIRILRDMEHRGIQFDPEKLEEGRSEIERRLEELGEEIDEVAGKELNPNSPKQVRQVLFEELDLPVIERTKTGPSTNAKVLRELSQKHQLPELIIEYRELDKLLNTYVDALPESVNRRTGRIHTSFNQTAVATGRLSSSEPNLQNIPKGSELGGELRKAFVAPEGYRLIGGDYSQVELRLLAHMAGDEELIRTFEEGGDLHRKTAARIFNVPSDEVDSKMRDRAKRVNFGIVYGITAYGLSRDLGVSKKEAQRYIDRFFDLYSRTKDFMDELVEEAEERGFASTLLNRRRYLPNINSNDWNRRNYDRRNAINTPIQGSAADLIKLAMIEVGRSLDRGELKGNLLLQVHDELILESPAERAEEAAEKLRSLMENVMELRVPLQVDTSVGKDWSEL